MAATTTTINGKTVNHGDKIVSFRGEVKVFDYVHNGRIYVKGDHVAYLHRVFVDVDDGDNVPDEKPPEDPA